jgi:hypothetical protein
MITLKLPSLKVPALPNFRGALTRLVRFVRRLFVVPRVWRWDRGGPGLEFAGKLVPVKPISPHHLVGAKAFPPSDKTYLYPWD